MPGPGGAPRRALPRRRRRGDEPVPAEAGGDGGHAAGRRRLPRAAGLQCAAAGTAVVPGLESISSSHLLVHLSDPILFRGEKKSNLDCHHAMVRNR